MNARAICRECGAATSRARHSLCLACRRPSVEAKLERYIDRSAGPNACWPWTKGRQPQGYGVLYSRTEARGKWYVHRLVLEATLGRPLAPGMEACHTCDNPPCCNPAHLYEGTHADNMQDMVRRGRRGPRRWFRRPVLELTP